jgi:hypothetical protein
MNDKKPDQQTIQRERAPGRMFDLYRGPNVIDIFVDGVAGAIAGPSMSKLDFFVVKDVKLEESQTEPTEIREVSLSIKIPTLQLMEFLTGFLGGVINNKDALTKAIEDQKQAMISHLNKVRVDAS